MCVEKVVRLYTKTFGGKIWKHLHSVSPDNIFDKKNSKWLPIRVSAKSYMYITLCKTFFSKNWLTDFRPNFLLSFLPFCSRSNQWFSRNNSLSEKLCSSNYFAQDGILHYYYKDKQHNKLQYVYIYCKLWR